MNKNYIMIVIIMTTFTTKDALQGLESTFKYNPTTESFEYQPSVKTDIKIQDDQTNQAIQSFIPSIQKLRSINESMIGFKSLSPAHKLIMNHLQKEFNNRDFANQQITLRSFDEFHIDTDFITDQNIQVFIKKFDSETEAVQSKLSDLWTEISAKYDTSVNKTQQTNSPDFNKPATINRDQAIMQLRTITEKVFDPNDKKTLSNYISEMKTTAQYLDTDKDSKIIESINFLQKNQHRTSIWDYTFWKNYAQTINPKDFHPIIQDSSITQIPLLTKINTLQNKVNVSTEK